MRKRDKKEGGTASDVRAVRVSAIPATGAVDQPRLHAFELNPDELAPDARPQPEVWMAVVAGALILPIWAVAPLAAVVHVAGLVLRRDHSWRRWRNIALVVAAGAASTAVARELLGSLKGDSRLAAAGLAAALVALVIGRLPLLRSTEGLAADIVNVARGVLIGAIWHYNPLIVPFAALPAVLVGRSLSLPRLQAEARLDAKTGLYNSRHFAHALDQELSRAKRYARPLSLIMVDLDLLRNVNNEYGHLAGDAVLQGVGDIFRAQVRTHDVPARFGGEEFAILLPETTPEQALELAERIRRAVAVRSFRADTSTQPLRATISLGVAAYPRDASDATQLVHRADLGVYRAKVLGRNRVVDATDAPD